MSFQIHALPYTPFAPLFTLPDAELARRGARRVSVDTNRGFPCRVSLIDASPGETVMLVNYTHQPADSPYRSSHAIYVREHAEQAFPDVDTVPEVLTRRLISVRAFDEQHDMIDADVVAGQDLAAAITAMLRDRRAGYLHLHNAKHGCFAASATRA